MSNLVRNSTPAATVTVSGLETNRQAVNETTSDVSHLNGAQFRCDLLFGWRDKVSPARFVAGRHAIQTR